MKLAFQALSGSIAIHVTYFFCMMLISYIRTRNYKPDFTRAWDNVAILQNEVSFSKANSSFLYLFTFVGVAVICGIIIFLYKTYFN